MTTPLFGLVASTAHAAPVRLAVTANVLEVGGTYGAGGLTVGDVLSGSFVFDTDETVASSAETTPGTVPGHEFTSFYEFAGPPYLVSLAAGPVFGGFANDAPVGVVVNDNLALSSAETAGAVADGEYDWIEVLGSTTTDLSGPHTPADGEEWTLAVIGDRAWFDDGSVIPDSLPGAYVALLVGVELDADGNETGFVVASADITTVPIPAAAWLFAAALGTFGCLGGKRRTA